MFLLSTLIIFITTAVIPLVVGRFSKLFPKIKIYPTNRWLPLLAACLFVVAFYIPNIHISSETTTFQQHFVGGGIYTACLYVYFRKLLGWQLRLVPALIILYAWTSAFGVSNELLEFTLTKLHLAHIGSGDTDWDLLANTLGSFVGYILLILFKVESVKLSDKS